VKRRAVRHSTVPRSHPPRTARRPAPPRRGPMPRVPPRREVARVLPPPDASLLDVIDSLLNKGVVLNADVILALANVDLIYLRLSALLCAADRVLPGRAHGSRK
jgi:Gas vesicle protein